MTGASSDPELELEMRPSAGMLSSLDIMVCENGRQDFLGGISPPNFADNAPYSKMWCDNENKNLGYFNGKLAFSIFILCSIW